MLLHSLALSCLACVGHGFRMRCLRQDTARSSDEKLQVGNTASTADSFVFLKEFWSNGQAQAYNPLNALTILLLAFDPLAAFNHGVRRTCLPMQYGALPNIRRTHSVSQRMVLTELSDDQSYSSSDQRIEPSLNNTWYAVGFSEQLQKEKLFATRLLGEPLVLYRDKKGNAVCVTDVCPHRSAPFSMGDVEEGVLRCFYHGWGFGENGKCVDIPTMPGDKAPDKKRFCATSYAIVEKDELLWVWRGNVLTADLTKLPHLPHDKKDFVVHTVLDYDVDWPYLVEKSLEVSHVSGFHSKSSPLTMLLEPKSGEADAKREYLAPNIVCHSDASGFSEEVHVVPIAPKRTRVLLRQRLSKGPSQTPLMQLPGTKALLTYLLHQNNYQTSRKSYSLMRELLSGTTDYLKHLTSGGDELIDSFRHWLGKAVEQDGVQYFKQWGPSGEPLAYEATGWQQDDAGVTDDGEIVGTYGLKKSYVRDHPIAEYAPMRKSTWR